ncbi:Negative regulator of mitosis [Fulvia fulva]|uniref:Negative regulator of mitosis n=1 Tax=Passalora fulva TaxID=5499 RepID=A0A9Q8UVK4_PASFU|nr:Negative regulator of mitosis [Fulvia fulva]KAK4611746.1 Negative regulator of mitosis [Fulvia fulva]KAK4613013.1 Negative regulator of mitosis [Fulvia fulva]UJO24053.1 Negative regulator of mitosis [Fulvia fulva]WPV21663.1 Negative regulator of mitosis [Fulvia fulva]WPV35842.1 Negative regulator of mitosis [Fulvia fulva]
MAAVKSLGVHTPAALSYLVDEGFLPPDPRQDQYQWTTWLTTEGGEDVEEELLTTSRVVVWSRGKLIRNVYRFDGEPEDVLQAVLTSFPLNSPASAERHPLKAEATLLEASIRPHLATETGNRTHQPRPTASGRALVVLLKTKAHIYFLSGSNHIVDLPFELERAFAAPRGIVLQRKRTAQPSLPPTPQLPRAPPNSFFFSSQAQQPNASFRHSLSPSLVKSFAKTNFAQVKPYQPSPLGAITRLDALFQEVITSSGTLIDEDVTNIYSLTDPLSDLGVVTFSLQHHRPRLYSKSQAGLSVEFEGLDPAEEVFYVSAQDELDQQQIDSRGVLTLLATFNADISTVTIWHGWYVEEKSLKELMKLHADQKEAKARRRSSFLNAGIGTGAATPGLRRRDGTRESFAGGGVLPGDPAISQATALSRNLTRQEEEQAMASQMDPDYQPVTSQPVREPRRVSSMNADVRASQTTVNASFTGTGGRRATSFGGPNTRRSLTHRKSRGSTPGSAYGQSQGDDETMDVDDTFEFDNDESSDDILRHMRATFEASGMDTTFGSADEGFKRELVVRKIHSFPLGVSTSSQGTSRKSADTLKLATILEPNDGRAADHKLGLYLHDMVTGDVQHVLLKIKQRKLWPEIPGSDLLAIPLLVSEEQLHPCEDILKLQDSRMSGVLCGRSRGMFLAAAAHLICPLPTPAAYKVYNSLDVPASNGDMETGKNRVLGQSLGFAKLKHAGIKGTYDEVSKDGIHHRLELQFRPRGSVVQELLDLCSLVLPQHIAVDLSKTWCVCHARVNQETGTLRGTKASTEMIALVAALFAVVIELLDSKARASLNLSGIAAGRSSGMIDEAAYELRRAEHDRTIRTASAWSWLPPKRRSPRRRSSGSIDRGKDQMLVIAAALADEISTTATAPSISDKPSKPDCAEVAAKLMLVLHIYMQEQKLNVLCKPQHHSSIAAVIAQLGSWLNLSDWSSGHRTYLNLEGASDELWAYVSTKKSHEVGFANLEPPLSVFAWFEQSLQAGSAPHMPTVSTIAAMGTGAMRRSNEASRMNKMTPRLAALSAMLEHSQGLSAHPVAVVEGLFKHGLTFDILEALPESMAAPFKEAIARCEKTPPTTWLDDLLQLVGRADLANSKMQILAMAKAPPNALITTRDVTTACSAVEHPTPHGKTKEAGRHSVSQLIFHEDRRLVDATSLMHFNSIQVAQCPKQPEWDEAVHFEIQRKVMHFVTIRMIALPAGDGMIHFDSQAPLLTEKYHLPGFNSSCLMQPMGHTMTTDRSGLTEEKVNWAYFHAGASAGLRISRHAEGIDTSWIAFNKPNELTNRHAGLLLALGLSGHLRQLAKWLSFKYLTPKHTMTSIGLLLGLSASYLGTMDGLITRMLSVHITRMLPLGAAELNVSPATQTAGLMGIGLLYYNSQHRRMSEIMLSEIESMDVEDPDSGPDPLRDESYRLAAGFALGFINLGKGNDLRGLHGMQLPERLLATAVGPRPVHAVHVFDRATAGAVMATALVFMKTGDRAIANKVDIPDTEAQYAHVRPDVLMLRAIARHVILWDDIEAKGTRDDGYAIWIDENMPTCYKSRIMQVARDFSITRAINSYHIPVFNIYTGLAFALGLKYAGTGNTLARDEILSVLKIFYRFDAAEAYFFDAKLGRSALKRCIDVLALSAATVMAGTGDLDTFRWLRRLHGRTDPETTYGSHLAAHLAIGVLFLGGGTITLGTSNLAIASLMVAFYPLFPMDVHDNRVHLQAFRHLWVFAAESRCIVVEDIDTQRPIHMPIKLLMKDGSRKSMQAPCLLPDLDSIKSVQTDNSAYWKVTLDFVGNPDHLTQFRKDQRVFVRRCPATEAHNSVFTATLAALTDTVSTQASSQQIWNVLANLPAFKDLDRADFELLLPPDIQSSVYSNERSTVVDDRLVLNSAVASNDGDALWNLRVLFAWAEKAKQEGDGKVRWIGEEVIEALKAGIEERNRPAVA